MKTKRRRGYRWKCEDCGLTYIKATRGEPRVGCPSCRRTGCKTYEGRERHDARPCGATRDAYPGRDGLAPLLVRWLTIAPSAARAERQERRNH